ncbi:hypothetical protein [Sphingobium sp. Z007]|uniref:hypothetical protein n=1 Tax=Sphingobium sp. Z007 TaxID=627495 RepID=UPI0015C5F016|nr:hypothetical protein [Sphingobium sp. Z007]
MKAGGDGAANATRRARDDAYFVIQSLHDALETESSRRIAPLEWLAALAVTLDHFESSRTICS